MITPSSSFVLFHRCSSNQHWCHPAERLNWPSSEMGLSTLASNQCVSISSKNRCRWILNMMIRQVLTIARLQPLRRSIRNLVSLYHAESSLVWIRNSTLPMTSLSLSTVVLILHSFEVTNTEHWTELRVSLGRKFCETFHAHPEQYPRLHRQHNSRLQEHKRCPKDTKQVRQQLRLALHWRHLRKLGHRMQDPKHPTLRPRKSLLYARCQHQRPRFHRITTHLQVLLYHWCQDITQWESGWCWAWDHNTG